MCQGSTNPLQSPSPTYSKTNNQNKERNIWGKYKKKKKNPLRIKERSQKFEDVAFHVGVGFQFCFFLLWLCPSPRVVRKCSRLKDWKKPHLYRETRKRNPCRPKRMGGILKGRELEKGVL